ncbi:MAG: Rieske 2Fe-2S domain-containing protein [Paraburkholderia sp.]|uniref:Rieske 2Fe-2S domain-containing protein n=1 Tax=Paraburkholderia sp. TaxID=1926495 RepID=UPI003C69FB1C
MTQVHTIVFQQKTARMRRLTETAAGTPMGQLLRRFWHPIAVSRDVEVGKAKAVRLLGEDLTLYRGESGDAYLVAGRCAHRLTMLHTGWVEGEEIRCMYHGWKYDSDGKCVGRPAEKSCREPNIRIAAYPVREYSGLIFTYIGDGEPPEFDLPRKDVFEHDGMLLFQRKEIWPCNWLQHVENSLDAVHVSFAHQMGKVGAFGEAITQAVPEVSYRETEAGICQTAVRVGSQVRVSDWTFPYGNHVLIPSADREDPWIETSHWMVPIDDERTMRIALFAVPSTTAEVDERLISYFRECEDFNSSDLHRELFAGQYPTDPLIRLTSAQDYVALVGQGVIADRVNECLGSSDAGIAMLRRILERELDAMASEGVCKKWRRLEQASILFKDGELIRG